MVVLWLELFLSVDMLGSRDNHYTIELNLWEWTYIVNSWENSRSITVKKSLIYDEKVISLGDSNHKFSWHVLEELREEHTLLTSVSE